MRSLVGCSPNARHELLPKADAVGSQLDALVRLLFLLVAFSELKEQLVDGHHEPSALACTGEFGAYCIKQTHLAFQDEV
jgi:hypothetical protein